MDREITARTIHRRGTSCASAVYNAFKDANDHYSFSPSPRSEGGKCGAVLAAEKVLKETGAEQIEVFEQRFKEKFGTLNCFELMNTGFDCSDFVGEAAAITEYLIDAKI